jgi:hypothetical protein
MTRMLRIAVPEYGVEADAVLHEDLAPRTCAALWDALAEPMRARGIHGMWVGPEVMLDMPPSHRTFQGADLPPENQTSFPIPGDLVWFHFHRGELPDLDEDLYEFGVVYDRNARMFGPTGWLRACVFGAVVTNLEALAAACRRFREDGRTDVVVSRLDA